MSVDLRQRLAEQVVIVLVQPLYPGNVGAAVRAMQNMGLERLVLVDPPAFDPETARWMAPGCDAAMDKLRIVSTLDEALEGVHRAVASTARHRSFPTPVVDTHALGDRIFDGPEEEITAILFGREDLGLDNEAVMRCDTILRIPTMEHASLNLSQALLVTAHDLFEGARRRGLAPIERELGGRKPRRAERRRGPDPRDKRADLSEIEPAVEALITLLDRVDYLRGQAPERVRLTARNALSRGGPSIKEVHALRGMINKIEWHLDHPEGE